MTLDFDELVRRVGHLPLTAMASAEPLWYVDCYTQDKAGPVNSYGPGTIDQALEVVGSVFRNRMSGITEVCITQNTQGCSPMSFEENARSR